MYATGSQLVALTNRFVEYDLKRRAFESSLPMDTTKGLQESNEKAKRLLYVASKGLETQAGGDAGDSLF